MTASRHRRSRWSNGAVVLGLAVPVLAALPLSFHQMPGSLFGAPTVDRAAGSGGVERIVAARLGPRPITQHKVSSFLPVHAPMIYGQYGWSERGVLPGRSWIVVDLDSQIMSVFRSGREIGTAVILYGGDSTPTPLGRFRVLARLKDHRSSLYDAPMPYTIRLTDDGVSIHGSNVVRGAATHGCIGIPTEFAARVFEAIRHGDEVTIVRSRREAGAGHPA